MVPRARLGDERRAGRRRSAWPGPTPTSPRASAAKRRCARRRRLNRRIAESTGDCVKILDLDGRLIYMNPRGSASARARGRQRVAEPPARRASSRERFARRRRRPSSEARRGGRGRFQACCARRQACAKWWDIVVTPITDVNGAVVQLLAVSRDITERRREEAFRAAQHQVLGMIATGSAAGRRARLPGPPRRAAVRRHAVLGAAARRRRHPRPARRRPEPSRRLRSRDRRVWPSVRAAARAGRPCSSARRIIVTDILTDPLWEDYRDVARRYGLRACWSTPIFSPQRKVLGSFAMYYDEPRTPSDEELRLIESAADIARIAIEQQRAHQALRHSEARNRAILRAIPDWMFLTTVDGVFLDYHARDASTLHAAAVGIPRQERHARCCRRRSARRSREAFARVERVGRARDRSNTRWGPTTASASTRRASSAATATRSSASSGTSPIASAPSWRPTRNDGSWRI